MLLLEPGMCTWRIMYMFHWLVKTQAAGKTGTFTTQVLMQWPHSGNNYKTCNLIHLVEWYIPMYVINVVLQNWNKQEGVTFAAWMSLV